MKKKTYYIGLDVHKETTAIAYTYSYSRAKPTYYKECGGSNRAIELNLKRLAKELGVAFTDLKVCYEAGPTGFVLARRLIQLGVDCVICSPSKTELTDQATVNNNKSPPVITGIKTLNPPLFDLINLYTHTPKRADIPPNKYHVKSIFLYF